MQPASDIWMRNLVTLENVKLLSRPEMETRKVPGIETPQHFGDARFQVENEEGETLSIDVGSHYWDAAIAQFAAIQGDRVTVTYLPYKWAMGNRSGVKLFFYRIEETPN
jgi:hypothetical protein